MKIKAYIVLKFLDYDQTKIDTPNKFKEYLFLPPESYASKEEFIKADENRDKIEKFQIYLDYESAKADAEWSPGSVIGDYGEVREIEIDLENLPTVYTSPKD